MAVAYKFIEKHLGLKQFFTRNMCATNFQHEEVKHPYETIYERQLTI